MATIPKGKQCDFLCNRESARGPYDGSPRVKKSHSIPLTDIPEDKWLDVVRRTEVIAWLDHQARTGAAIAEACERLQLGRSQVYVMLRRFRADRRTTNQLPARPGPRKGACRIAPASEAVLNACIKRCYLSRQKLSVADLYREIKHDCQAADLPVPSPGTVRRRVAALALSLVVRARDGSAAARQRFTPLRGSLEAEYPLDLVQIDHTLTDTIIVDDVHRRHLGRAWLTVVFDVCTRVVCGFYISLEHPSVTSVALAITHAVLPKGPWLSANDLTLAWPVAGLPKRIHVDNAREFHSRPLMRACQQHGISLEFRPPGQPHFGGHIERFLGTLMRRVHKLPGATFSNVQERGDVDPEASAVLTLSEFRQVIALEVLGTYHHEVHTALGMPPLAAWAERIGSLPSPPVLPQSPDEFRHSFLPFKEVVVRREGVRLHSIFYYDDVLTPWIGLSKERLRAKYDPNDLSQIFLEDSTGRHWPIRYRDLRRPPITLWEQRAAVRYMREQGMGKIDETAIFNAVEAHRAIVADATKQTRAARREAQRTAHLTSNRPPTAAAAKMAGAFSDPAAASDALDEAQIPWPQNAQRIERPQPSDMEQETTNIVDVARVTTTDDAEVPMPAAEQT